MVSTRGVKFKFAEGEKVLCYEPDPTKAKVLYESKVLDLVMSRDSRGRKVAEYLIHFNGWNSSWDRCVSEDFILPDTEENRNLQSRLAKEAAEKLSFFNPVRKGKRKRKLPAILKDSFKKLTGTENNQSKSQSRPKNEETSSESSDEGYEDRVIEIWIPPVLKKKLEDDCYWITMKHKAVNIPCNPCVVSLLEGYVKHLAVNLVCSSPTKGPRSQRQTPQFSSDIENRIYLCKEVMDGLRIYFDFALSSLLLYRQERKQYSSVGCICHPVSSVKKDEPTNSIKTADRLLSSPKKTSTGNALQRTTTLTSHENQNQAQNNTPLTRARSPSLVINPADKTKEVKPPVTPGRRPRGSTALSKVQATARILRSAEKTRSAESQVQKENASMQIKSEPVETIDSSSQKTKSLSPPRTGRQKEKVPTPRTRSDSGSHSLPQSATNSQCSNQTGCPPSPGAGHSSRSPPLGRAPNLSPLHMTSVSSVSSSNSSTHSSTSFPAMKTSKPETVDPAGVLNEVLSWHMVPPHLYEQAGAPASLIYGPQHLLRLFIKLPELIQKMNLPNRKLRPVLEYVNDFLKYLADRHEELFLLSAYIDVTEACPES